MSISFIACGDSQEPFEQNSTIEVTSIADKAAADKAAADKAAADKAAVANGRAVLATAENRSHIAQDDGATKRGLLHTYSKSSNIVTDNLTQLEWQDDVSSKRTNWEEAISYCSRLTIDGLSNWRLPTMQELQTLIRLDNSPNIDTIFTTKKGAKYWTSSKYPYETSKLAYYIDFSTGFSANYGDRSIFGKSQHYFVRCVRGDVMKEGKFTRDTAKETVTDSTTNLMWEDTSHIQQTSGVQSAINHCENLTLGGYSDWTLPNLNELYTITDRKHYDAAINDTFEHKISIGTNNNNEHYRKANFWTSTYYGAHPNLSDVHYYRTLNARDGASHRCRSHMGMHTRCVRKVK